MEYPQDKLVPVISYFTLSRTNISLASIFFFLPLEDKNLNTPCYLETEKHNLSPVSVSENVLTVTNHWQTGLLLKILNKHLLAENITKSTVIHFLFIRYKKKNYSFCQRSPYVQVVKDVITITILGDYHLC